MTEAAPLDTPDGDAAWRFRGFHTFPSSIEAQAAFLDVAGSLAALSTHPAAAEIHRIARWNGRGTLPVTGFRDFAERGFGGAVLLAGEAAPRAALLGTREFLAGAGLAVPEVLEREVRVWEEEGSSVLLCGWDGQVRAALRFSGPAG